jgi:2,4-dienoyl-CoA reductase (NADPH2)
MLDLVEGGNSWQDIVTMGKAIEAAGATLINTGIGWHETRIPTIATSVPRAAFTWVTEKMKAELSIPLITTNRINTPEIAEKVLAQGHADVVSMARPFLADENFVNKAANNKSDEINICIGCNQACLDHVFQQKRASCLVNPQACYETELVMIKADKPKNIAVVGAGPAGLAFAVYAAKRGHTVTLFDRLAEIGGQFNVAKQIPGKEEFYETLSYFGRQLALLNVTVKLNVDVDIEQLKADAFDDVVLATGIKPRALAIEGIDNPIVKTYLEVLKDKTPIGNKVAIIGAGGIGFDVATYLVETGGEQALSKHANTWLKSWGIDKSYQHNGALMPVVESHGEENNAVAPNREVYLLQRKSAKVGAGLGKTTGWIHRSTLTKKGVKMLKGVSYQKITDQGIEISIDGEVQLLAVDHIIICAGQEPNRDLYQALVDADVSTHLIGGAFIASELDAKRAIRQAAELAAVI